MRINAPIRHFSSSNTPTVLEGMMKNFQQPSVSTRAFKPLNLDLLPSFSIPPNRLRSLQYSLIADKERPDGHPGGLLSRGNSALQLHGRRAAAHLAVPPSLHQRFPEADLGGVRLQADLLFPLPQPGTFRSREGTTPLFPLMHFANSNLIFNLTCNYVS